MADPNVILRWDERGFASDSDYLMALVALQRAESSGAVDAATASRIRATGQKSAFDAVLAPLGTAPPVTTARPRPSYANPEPASRDLQSATQTYVEQEREFAVRADPQATLTTEQQAALGARIGEQAAALATAPRTQSGELASTWWEDFVTPKPGEWGITTALRPQKVMTQEETAAVARARASGDISPVIGVLQDLTTYADPKSGETYENTIGWLGRVLGAPASALVGALDPKTSVAERVALGEGFAGGLRDIDYAYQESRGIPYDTPFADRSPGQKAEAAIAYGLGFVGDLLVPLDLGVGDAAKGAALGAKLADVGAAASDATALGRAVAVGKGALLGAGRELPGIGRVVPDVRAGAVDALAASRSAADVRAAQQWVKAVERTAPTASSVDIPEQIQEAVIRLGLPTDIAKGRELLALATRTNPADPVPQLLRSGAAARVAQGLEDSVIGLSRRAVARVGNLLVSPEVVAKVKTSLEASPLKAARESAAPARIGENLVIEGDAAARLVDWLRASGTASRFAAERTSTGHALYDVVNGTAPVRQLAFSPDEWNDLVRVAAEAEAYRLADGAVRRVTDIPALDTIANIPRRAAEAERLRPEPMRRSLPAATVKEALRTVAVKAEELGRNALGWQRAKRVRDIPPALQEWADHVARAVAQAPDLLQHQLRMTAREGTMRFFNPWSPSEWSSAAARHRAAFEAVYRELVTLDQNRDTYNVVELMSYLFDKNIDEVREVLFATAAWGGDSLVSKLADAMTRGTGNATPVEAAARVLASIGGRTLNELLSPSDLTRLVAEQGFDADHLARLGRIRANGELAKNPVGVITAFLIQRKAENIAASESVRLLRLLGADHSMAPALLSWTRGRMSRLQGLLKARGVDVPVRDVARFVIRELVDDASGKSLSGARQQFLGAIQSASDEATAKRFIRELYQFREPYAQMTQALDSAPPTAQQIKSTLNVLETYIKGAEAPATTQALTAIESAGPYLAPVVRQRLAQRVEQMLGDTSSTSKMLQEVGGLPMLRSITDDIAEIVGSRNANINDVFEKLGTLPPEQSASITRALGAVAETMYPAVVHPLQTVGNVARQGMLGGYWLPNLAFHGVNVLTAPLIVWGVLGGDRAIGAVRRIFRANRATRFLYGRLGGLPLDGENILVRTPSGRSYTTREIVKLATENGALGGQAVAELTTSVLEDIIRWTGKTAGGKNIGAIRDILRRNMDPRTMSWASEIGQTMDARFRFGVFIDALERGATEDEASQLARTALFDYNDLAAWERASLARIIWFYRFARSSVVNLFGALTSHPARVRNLLRISQGGRSFPSREQELARDAVFPQWADTRPLITPILADKQTAERYALFGPPVPMADAAMQVVSLLSLARALSDPEFTGSERLSATASDAASDAAARTGPFVAMAYDLVTGERPEIGGARPDSTYLDPRYVMMLKATGLWDTFTAHVPVESIAPSQATPRKEVTTFDGRVWRVQDTPEARRTWALMQDAALAMAIGRPIRDLLGPLAFYLDVSGQQVQPGQDLAQDVMLEDVLRGMGAARPFYPRTEAQQSEEQKKSAARELRERTPKPPR